MDAEMEAFETHMDRMEREKQAQDSQLAIEREKTKRAKIEARADTKEMITWVLGILIGCAALVATIFFIWQGTKGPSASQQLEDKWRTECIAHNGAWIPGGNSNGSSAGTCYVLNGKAPVIIGKP